MTNKTETQSTQVEMSFEQRLLAAMAEMSNPKKDSTATVMHKGGGQHSYKYTTLDQVLDCVRPALQKHGLDLRQSCTVTAEGKLMLQTTVIGDDRSQVLDMRPLSMSADPQAFGSFETYMRRYALLTCFALAGEDDDGKVAKEATERKPAKVTDADAIEKGIKALADLGCMDDATIRTIIGGFETDSERLKWLRVTYAQNNKGKSNG